jgi:uncharacterized MnhB-related membrane protein
VRRFIRHSSNNNNNDDVDVSHVHFVISNIIVTMKAFCAVKRQVQRKSLAAWLMMTIVMAVSSVKE